MAVMATMAQRVCLILGEAPFPLLHRFLLAISAACFLPIPATAAQAAQDEAPERLPEEIVVTGHDISRLRELVDESEDHMYALYNELNDDDFYDIHCHHVAKTGTKLKTKQCRPTFLLDAERRQALGLLTGDSYTPPASVLGHHLPILENKMKALVQEHPEFFDAVLEHHHLREVLNESRRLFHDE